MPFVSLITDFGTRDWFVGVMKGIFSRLSPSAIIIDITHEISPGDIRAGALALRCAHTYFPPGGVHLAVIDPGVGGPRHALAIRTPQAFFVGPDNGVLSWALQDQASVEVRRLENPGLFLSSVSRTFHGRDVFAPVAARLVAGEPFQNVGPLVTDFIQLPWPAPNVSKTELVGEILHIDRFGNAMTNLRAEDLRVLPEGAISIEAGRGRNIGVASCYADVSIHEAAGVLGSADHLEICVNGGNAAETLFLKVGSEVRVHSIRESKVGWPNLQRP